MALWRVRDVARGVHLAVGLCMHLRVSNLLVRLRVLRVGLHDVVRHARVLRHVVLRMRLRVLALLLRRQRLLRLRLVAADRHGLA